MGDIVILGMPISLGTMIYQAFAFTVLTWVLHKYAVKKLVKVIENRKESIAKQLTLAEKNKMEAEKLLKEQTELLQKAKQEGISIIESSRRDAEQIVKDARKDAMRIRAQAFEELQKRRSVMNNEKDIC